MAGCTSGPRADRRPLSAAPRRDPRGASPARTRAIVTDLAEQSERRGVQRSVAARGERALPRSRALPHRRRGLRVLHLRIGARTSRPGRLPDAARHTISMYSLLEGMRLRRLAHRLHGRIRTISQSAMMKAQDTILVCAPVVSQVAAAAALDVGRAYCDAVRPRARGDPRHRARRAADRSRRSPKCRRPTARSTCCSRSNA